MPSSQQTGRQHKKEAIGQQPLRAKGNQYFGDSQAVEDFEALFWASGCRVQAVEMVEKLQPDVILMDIDMPEMGGVEAARAILHQSPSTGVVMVTMLEDDKSVFSTMRARIRAQESPAKRTPANDTCRCR